MALEQWRPRGGLSRTTSSEMGDLFNRFFREWPWWPAGSEGRAWAPSVDMMDRKDDVLVRADLPGLDQKDISVTLENNMLTIHGERREEQDQHEHDYYTCERWSGSFFRSLAIPPDVDTSNIQASFKNGVLEIRIPKKKEAMGKRIEVKAA